MPDESQVENQDAQPPWIEESEPSRDHLPDWSVSIEQRASTIASTTNAPQPSSVRCAMRGRRGTIHATSAAATSKAAAPAPDGGVRAVADGPRR